MLNRLLDTLRSVRAAGESAGAPVAREPGAVDPEVSLLAGLPAPACRPALASGATRRPGAAFLMYVQ